MKQHLLFTLLCSISFFTLLPTACHRHPLEQKVFPQEYRLTSLRVPLGSYPLGFMELKNDFLIFCGYSFFVFSAKDYSFIGSFRDKEQQGTEQQGTFQLPQILRSSSPSYLYIMDAGNKNEIWKYQIDLHGTPTLLQTSFTGVNTSMNRPYILADSLIVYDEFVPEASIKIHNLYTNTTESSLHYGTTTLDDRFFDKNMGGLYVNDSCIVFAYKYQDRIDFYDWQLNLKHSVDQQKSVQINLPEMNPFRRPNNTSFYGASYLGKNYFYTLYRGVSESVFRSDSVLIYEAFNIYMYGLTRDVLEVYDLDGQPISRYHFDDISPGTFIVDEERNLLLGFRGNSDSLLVYQLQGLSMNGKKDATTAHNFPSSLPVIPEPESPKEMILFKSISGFPDIEPSYLVRSIGSMDHNQVLRSNQSYGAYTVLVKQE